MLCVLEAEAGCEVPAETEAPHLLQMPGEEPDAQYAALVSRTVSGFLDGETDEGYRSHSSLISICHTGCSPRNRPTVQEQDCHLSTTIFKWS